jgi:hypothetical protein
MSHLCKKCKSRIAAYDNWCEYCVSQEHRDEMQSQTQSGIRREGNAQNSRKGLLSKLKELWSKAVFRWCVYQTSLLVFGLLLKFGELSYGGSFWHIGKRYEIWQLELDEISILIWILISTLPAVWVWRKPLFSWLNKKAEEG